MRGLKSSLPLALLCHHATAFYPYAPPGSTTPTRRAVEPVERRDDNVIRMPIRRTPVKRDNTFNVISAEPPSQTDSIGVHQDGSDFSYFSNFRFGTSEEDYHMLIDSGASNTWVMSSECSTDACGAHDLFGSEDSTSLTVSGRFTLVVVCALHCTHLIFLQASNDPFNMTYGTGSVDGILAEDEIRFGDFSVPMTFGLATNVSIEFLSYPMDGILGLGRPGVTSVGTSALLEVMVEANVIAAKVFGLHLSRTADGLNDGELNFGIPNPERYDGELSYTSALEDTGFWEIPIDDAGVDGNALSLTGRTAIIDSGTSFVLMPPSDAQQMHSLIPGAAQNGEQFTVPCSSRQSMQITFSGVTFDISYKDYVGRETGDGQACFSNVVGRQTFGDTQWLVGDVFLKNVYAVFDLDQNRVGFGTKADSPTSTDEESSASSDSPAESSSSTPQTPNTGTSTSGSPSTANASSAMPLPCTPLPSHVTLAAPSAVSDLPSLSPFRSLIPTSSISTYMTSAPIFCPAPEATHFIPQDHSLNSLSPLSIMNHSVTLLAPTLSHTTSIIISNASLDPNSNSDPAYDNGDDDPIAAGQTELASTSVQEGAANPPASAANSMLALILALCVAIALP